MAGETAPQRTARLLDHRGHQARKKARRLAELDELLGRADAALGGECSKVAPPCGAFSIDWAALQPGLDPCSVSTKMGAHTQRGQRKRESILAMAFLLESALLPGVSNPNPTIVDCGCGTGSLMLPLASVFPHATFVGIDYKLGSIERLGRRAAEAGDEIASRIVPWHGRIESYDGACDVVLALHACGEASDAALRLAAARGVPYAVSPCCVGKIRRGPASAWLRLLIDEQVAVARVPNAEAREPGEGDDEVPAARVFGLLASWADSEHVAAAPVAPSTLRNAKSAIGASDRGGGSDSPASTSADAAASAAAAAAHLEAATRRQRCKTLVELDRLFAMSEQQQQQQQQQQHDDDEGGSPSSDRRGDATTPPTAAGRLLRITGPAMATSSQREVLTGPLQ
jgi:hypothetical protein